MFTMRTLSSVHRNSEKSHLRIIQNVHKREHYSMITEFQNGHAYLFYNFRQKLGYFEHLKYTKKDTIVYLYLIF